MTEHPMTEATPQVGQWAIYEDPSYLRFAYRRALVEKVTAKQLAVTRNTGYVKRIARSLVVACVDTEEAAKLLIQSLDGVAGEFRRRQRAAEDERSRRISEADGAARKQIARLIASHQEPQQ